MADKARILFTGYNNAFFNMGLDEAILGSVAAGSSPPTLRFYGWKPAAISLGYFQGINEEVDIQACRDRGIDVVRRVTGGGAVFHDAELTYSIVIPERHRLAPDSITDSYEILCAGIVQGLSILGVESKFVPINDIVSAGRKISGNAQTRKKGCLLQHGTILLDVDVEKMFSLLMVPKEKAKGKLIEDVKARVGSLSSILGRPVGFDETASAMEKGFISALDLDPLREVPSEEELILASRLADEKFSQHCWVHKR